MSHLGKNNWKKGKCLKQTARKRSWQIIKCSKPERKLLSQSESSGYQIELTYLSSK